MLHILASIYMVSLINALILLALEGMIPESPESGSTEELHRIGLMPVKAGAHKGRRLETVRYPRPAEPAQGEGQ